MNALVCFVVVLTLWGVASPACDVNNKDIVDPDPDCPDNKKLTEAELASGKFEGDIDLTKNQKAVVEGRSRNALIDPSRLWPKRGTTVTVPYDDDGAGILARFAFRRGRRQFEKHTCIRFKERTSEPNYIKLVSGSGCFSKLGMKGGKQDLSLGAGCRFTGIAIHEIMHAVGFLHEQSRPDRDNHVNVFLQNVQEGKESQFRKGHPNIVYNIRNYDYRSVMHYSSTAFSKNGRFTLLPKVGSEDIIGQRQGLSVNDVRKVNELYKC